MLQWGSIWMAAQVLHLCCTGLAYGCIELALMLHWLHRPALMLHRASMWLYGCIRLALMLQAFGYIGPALKLHRARILLLLMLHWAKVWLRRACTYAAQGQWLHKA